MLPKKEMIDIDLIILQYLVVVPSDVVPNFCRLELLQTVQGSTLCWSVGKVDATITMCDWMTQGNLKIPDLQQDIIHWVSASWEGVSEEIVKKSFKNTGISNNLAGNFINFQNCFTQNILPLNNYLPLAFKSLHVKFNGLNICL